MKQVKLLVPHYTSTSSCPRHGRSGVDTTTCFLKKNPKTWSELKLTARQVDDESYTVIARLAATLPRLAA